MLASSQVGLLEEYWNQELKKESPSLTKAIIMANKTQIIIGIIWVSSNIVCKLGLPFVIREIIDWMISEQKDDTVRVKCFIISLVFYQILCILLQCIILQSLHLHWSSFIASLVQWMEFVKDI